MVLQLPKYSNKEQKERSRYLFLRLNSIRENFLIFIKKKSVLRILRQKNGKFPYRISRQRFLYYSLIGSPNKVAEVAPVTLTFTN